MTRYQSPFARIRVELYDPWAKSDEQLIGMDFALTKDEIRLIKRASDEPDSSTSPFMISWRGIVQAFADRIANGLCAKLAQR